MNVSLLFAPYRPKRSCGGFIVSLSEVERNKIGETETTSRSQQQTTAFTFSKNNLKLRQENNRTTLFKNLNKYF